MCIVGMKIRLDPNPIEFLEASGVSVTPLLEMLQWVHCTDQVLQQIT